MRMHAHIHMHSPTSSLIRLLIRKEGERGRRDGGERVVCCVIMAFTKSLLCLRLKCLLGEH